MLQNKKAAIIAITNQKGGVGKTTTAVNLSAFLAEMGKKTLLVDLDPQSNASSGVGIDVPILEKSVYHGLLGLEPLQNIICPSVFENLHVLPATQDLAAVEIELADHVSRETFLKESLKSVYSYYDFIVLDCPPSLGILTLNGLVASDKVVVPVQCEYFALEGIGHLVHTLERVQERLNPSLEIAGIVMTMFDRRTSLNREVVDSTRRFFKDLVFETIVPRNIRLSEAPSHGIPIMLYNPGCAGSVAYSEFAKEVVDRVKVG